MAYKTVFQRIGGIIYAIQAGSEGPVKIGFTGTCDARTRLKALQGANHEKLRVVAEMPGFQPWESEIHRGFAEDRIRGEWFKPSAAVRDWIKANPPYDEVEDAVASFGTGVSITTFVSDS